MRYTLYIDPSKTVAIVYDIVSLHWAGNCVVHSTVWLMLGRLTEQSHVKMCTVGWQAKSTYLIHAQMSAVIHTVWLWLFTLTSSEAYGFERFVLKFQF